MYFFNLNIIMYFLNLSYHLTSLDLIILFILLINNLINIIYYFSTYLNTCVCSVFDALTEMILLPFYDF